MHQVVITLIVTAFLTVPAFAQDAKRTPARFAPAGLDDVLLHTAAELGDARRFCVDFPGFPVSGRVAEYREANWPMGTHTCKTSIPEGNIARLDQLVSRSALLGSQGAIHFSRLAVCLEVVTFEDVRAPEHVQENSLREDAQLLAMTCSGQANQRFNMDMKGRIRPVLDRTKCLTVGKEAFEAGERTPGQPWLRRDLQLSRCEAAESAYQKWVLASPE